MYLSLARMPLLAMGLFLFASLTDMVDGLIARKTRQVSKVGKFADPVADKLLVSAIFVTFIQLGEITAVPVVIILSREFLITGLRLLAMAKGTVISASWVI